MRKLHGRRMVREKNDRIRASSDTRQKGAICNGKYLKNRFVREDASGIMRKSEVVLKSTGFSTIGRPAKLKDDGYTGLGGLHLLSKGGSRKGMDYAHPSPLSKRKDFYVKYLRPEEDAPEVLSVMRLIARHNQVYEDYMKQFEMLSDPFYNRSKYNRSIGDVHDFRILSSLVHKGRLPRKRQLRADVRSLCVPYVLLVFRDRRIRKQLLRLARTEALPQSGIYSDLLLSFREYMKVELTKTIDKMGGRLPGPYQGALEGMGKGRKEVYKKLSKAVDEKSVLQEIRGAVKLLNLFDENVKGIQGGKMLKKRLPKRSDVSFREDERPRPI